jgi:FKBP12-rapamycin complex-associated protein
MQRYQESKDPTNVHQAWDLYFQVFRSISQKLPHITKVDLQFVSPKLTAARDLELAVPGKKGQLY